MADKNVGKIIQVISAVLDIKFSEGNLPEINDAVEVPLKNGGKLFVIYPASALSALFFALQQARFEPKRMRLVYSKAGGNALRVLIEAKKDGKPGLVIEPALIAEE